MGCAFLQGRGHGQLLGVDHYEALLTRPGLSCAWQQEAGKLQTSLQVFAKVQLEVFSALQR